MRLIDSVKSNISATSTRRDIAEAKLDSVLINANVDSASTLTSEAYALIRFNTEYLIRMLAK